MNKYTLILSIAFQCIVFKFANAKGVYAYDIAPIKAKVSTNIRGFIGEVTTERYVRYKLSGGIYDNKIIPLENIDNVKSLPRNWNQNALHVLALYIRACQVDDDVVRMLVDPEKPLRYCTAIS